MLCIAHSEKGPRFEIDSDPRHAEVIVSERGLTSGKIKTVDTPESRGGMEDTKQHRSLTSVQVIWRWTGLILDIVSRPWPDACNNREQLMCSGRGGWERYLKGTSRVVQGFWAPSSRAGKSVEILVDGDTGDLNTRRSTVGHGAFPGNRVVTHACNLLPVIGPTVPKNEYNAISVESCTCLGLHSLLRGLQCDHISSNCIRFGARRSPPRRGLGGKMKHTHRDHTCGHKNDWHLDISNWTFLQAKRLAVTQSQRS